MEKGAGPDTEKPCTFAHGEDGVSSSYAPFHTYKYIYTYIYVY